MTRVGIFAAIGLIALVVSCAGEEKAPRSRGTGKKAPPARATHPASAPSPRTRPATAPLPTTTRAAAPTAREMARTHATSLILERVGMALDRYNNDLGHYPTGQEGGLGALLDKPQFDDYVLARNWRGPYLKRMARDPWGRQIEYERVEDPKGNPRFRIWSPGPDRQSGTDDDIKKWLDW